MEREHLEKVDLDGKIILKLVFIKECGLNWSGVGQRRVAVFFERGDEFSVSLKWVDFIE